MVEAALSHQDAARTGVLITDLVLTALIVVVTLCLTASHYMKVAYKDMDREALWDVIKQCVAVALIGGAFAIGGLAFAWYLMINFN